MTESAMAHTPPHSSTASAKRSPVSSSHRISTSSETPQIVLSVACSSPLLPDIAQQSGGSRADAPQLHREVVLPGRASIAGALADAGKHIRTPEPSGETLRELVV